MRSLTGFGRGESALGGARIVVELRSVNHRYLEVRVRTPRELSAAAAVVEGAVRGRVARGRVDAAVQVESSGTGLVTVDPGAARAAVSALETLRKAVGTEEPISLALVAAVPGVLTSIAEIDPGATQRALLDATSRALDALTESRATEGAALEKELVRLLAEARSALGSIGERAQGAVERLRAKTRERVHRIIETADSARVEQEIVHLADRADITEELARLDSHFAELARLTADPTEPNGRRIDFLLQEAAREANTIGSKGSDAQIAQRVVDLRTAIERMREQAQNVE